MEERNYGSGIKSYSMTGDEALNFLDGLTNQAGARDLVDEGARLFQAGDLSGAEAKFKEAIVANPNNAVAHGNIGAIYFQRRQFQNAIPWLEKALALDPHVAGVADCLRECRVYSQSSPVAPQKSAVQPKIEPKSKRNPWWQFWK